MDNIYANIAARTGGNIYIGVVGPVRTGKSTLIKRVMESLVIPNIHDPYRAERATDELPQSASGKTIMTSEPKFVPEEAVEITPDNTTTLWIRMIDSVGYMVAGAVGAMEDGKPRLVSTPWYDYDIPLTEAAELGTKKVMEEHCSIGLVVTTDGTITDIPRQDYEQAEDRAISDMKKTGKPFLVIINSSQPHGEAAKALQKALLERHDVNAAIADCQTLTTEEISELLQKLLYAFPLTQLHIHIPRWLDVLEADHPLKTTLYETLLQCAQQVHRLEQAAQALEPLSSLPDIQQSHITNIDPATGIVRCVLRFPDKLFYQILSEKVGISIDNDGELLSILSELANVKKEYDQISEALQAARTTGYGIVLPNAEQMTLEQPQIVRKGGAFGVTLKASTPSIHMIRVDIDTQISPMVGGEQQSQELINYLTDEDPQKLWQSNIFGRSLYSLIQEGLTAKLVRTPEDVRIKIRGALGKIVNEGANGLICLIL